jgi:hypothetical protein
MGIESNEVQKYSLLLLLDLQLLDPSNIHDICITKLKHEELVTARDVPLADCWPCLYRSCMLI